VRHSRVLRLVWVLRDGQPTAFLDPLQAERAVARYAGKHDCHRLRPMRLRQRAKEDIHRRALASEVMRFRQAQMPI
jgi:hypothetical protein